MAGNQERNIEIAANLSELITPSASHVHLKHRTLDACEANIYRVAEPEDFLWECRALVGEEEVDFDASFVFPGFQLNLEPTDRSSWFYLFSTAGQALRFTFAQRIEKRFSSEPILVDPNSTEDDSVPPDDNPIKILHKPHDWEFAELRDGDYGRVSRILDRIKKGEMYDVLAEMARRRKRELSN